MNVPMAPEPMGPGARVQSGQPAIYLADLGRCRPQSALSSEPERHRWQVLEYETEALSGTMLLVGEETAAPEVTYPLCVRGWHAIYLGVYHRSPSDANVVRARLTGDPCFSLLEWVPARKGYPAPPERNVVRELFWKAADLTDQEIIFGQLSVPVGSGDEPSSSHCESARIAYVKLAPLSDAEVRLLPADRQDSDRRRLFAHNDAHGPHYAYRLSTPEEIYREIEPYRNTDFSRLYWEAGGGDMANFLTTRVGRLPTCDGETDFGRVGDRLHAESWRLCRDRGMDPLWAAVDFAHQAGLEIHAGYRPAGFYWPHSSGVSGWNRGGLYGKHPELRGVARDGSPSPTLSYTFPETRRFVISFLREVAQYPVDGICIHYARRPPLVEYEPPLVEGFRAEYGLDPRQLDERDPRWLAYRSRVLTQFMREVRQEMDAVAREQGRARRIQVSADVMGHEEENRLYGMDVRAWIAEGLVDTIIPHTTAPAPRLDGGVESWTDPRDAEYWVSVTKGTPCQLALNLMPRNLSPEQYYRKAAGLYRAGVEHLFFWDCAGGGGRADYSPSWDAIRRLGHREEIAAWVQAGGPSLLSPSVPVRKVGDWDLSYRAPG